MPTAEVHHCHLAKASSTMVLARWILGFSNCSRRTHPPGIGRDLGERWNWNSTVHRLFCEPFSNERKILKGGSGCHQRWRVFFGAKSDQYDKANATKSSQPAGSCFFFSCGWLMIGFTSLSSLWLQKRRHREKPPAFRWGCRRSGR
jgi:hypothetical protein